MNSFLWWAMLSCGFLSINRLEIMVMLEAFLSDPSAHYCPAANTLTALRLWTRRELKTLMHRFKLTSGLFLNAMQHKGLSGLNKNR